MRTLADLLFANPSVRTAGLALVYGRRRISFAELQARVLEIAAALRRDGVAAGDRVALLIENTPEFVEVFFAVTALGAIIVPLNHRLHPSEHVALMQDAEPCVFITSPAFETTRRRAEAEVGTLRLVVVGSISKDRPSSFGGWLAKAPAATPLEEFDPKAPAAILYTSGTTSGPKGAVLSHGNYVSMLDVLSSEIPIFQGDVNLQLSPLYHAAFIHTLLFLANGAASLLNDKFEPVSALEQIQSERVTFLFAVPTMLYQMLDHPRFQTFDLSSLRLIAYGAAPITGERLRRSMDAFGQRMLHSYGLTESTSHCSILGSQEHLVAPGSIGRGLTGLEIAVVNPDGSVCAPGVVGEIRSRGAHIMQGYWRRPAATAETIVDGWLNTGDLARRDSQGYIYIVDRAKDMVVSGGVNIYTREVEDVISAYPAVGDVAVFGIDDPHWGEAVIAAVVLRPEAAFAAADLLAFCRGRLAGYKTPKRVEVVEVLPKNATGKTLKRVLRDRFGAAASP